MRNHNRDNKYDEIFIDKLVQVLNLHSTQIQTKSDEPRIFVWYLERGEMRTLDVTANIVTISLISDGSKALVCQKDIVTLWNLTNLSKIVDITPQDSRRAYEYTSAVFSPDGKKFVVAQHKQFNSNYFRIYDSEGNPLGDEFINEQVLGRPSRLLWFSDNKNWLINTDVRLHVVESARGNSLLAKYTFPSGNQAIDISISPDDSKIAIAGVSWINDPPEMRGLVQVFVATNLSLKHSLLFGRWADSVTFNNSGDRVLFSCNLHDEFTCNRYPIVNWDYANNTIVGRLFGGHTNIVRSLTRCRENSDYFFSGGEDGKVFLWNMKTGQVAKRLKGHSNSVFCVDLSADCKVGISAQVESQYINKQMVRRVLESNSRMIARGE